MRFWIEGGSSSAATPTSNISGSLTLDLNKPVNQALATVGGPLVLDANELDSLGLLLYRSSDNAVPTFSRKCIHLGCRPADFRTAYPLARATARDSIPVAKLSRVRHAIH
jgi:hypothetical protein